MILIKFTSDKHMVDCDYFTDFNKDRTIEHDRILLEFKKSNYSLEMYLF